MKRTVGEHARIKGSIVASGREFQGTRYIGTHAATSDPAEMTALARMAELGSILAPGYRRLLLSTQNQLAEWGSTERSCDSVDETEKHREEVA